MPKIYPGRIKSERHPKDFELTLPPPLPVQMRKPRLPFLMRLVQEHMDRLPVPSPALSVFCGTTVPLANPYICTHHGVLSQSLMTKAIFHKRI